MALWILTRPREKTERTERRVAEVLNKLPDTWLIRWGYLYSRGSADVGEHEGDFIIQGPSGHVLVLEVKGSRVRNFVLTGKWDGEEDGESPWVQLNEEWTWARSRAESVRGNRAMPFFQRALALPFVHFVPGDQFLASVPRSFVLGAHELNEFRDWWDRHVASAPLHSSAADARGIFRDAFCEGLRPKAIRAFIQGTEGIFERSVTEDFRLLSLLSGNRQLMIEGGAGTGKTSLAVCQAKEYANSGLRTLLLCYNLALAEYLRRELGRSGLPPERVDVLSWEELTARLLRHADIEHKPPVEYADRVHYFGVMVPGLILEVLKDNPPVPAYDALVVDEAQDHDTLFPSELSEPELPGWWHFYFALLREGKDSRISLFYDPAQRPRFRGRERFDDKRLRRCLSQCAHVRLRTLHRYTRPVHEFLLRLRGTGASALVTELGHPEEPLPEGPDVEVLHSSGDPGAIAISVARRWEACGLCRLKDIVILGPRSSRGNSSLSHRQEIAGIRLVDFTAELHANDLRYLSIHKAKGLDFLAVILIDLPDPALAPEKEDLHELLFMGASRTRQLLAVVHASAPKTATA
jgi:hypothetical protein